MSAYAGFVADWWSRSSWSSAGVVINLLFSATPALPVGLLFAAAALFALVLLLIRGRV
jgi:hypothetical protein